MAVVLEKLPTGFLGRSPRIVQLREQIERLGSSRSPVLLQGESGTGKEVAARALYNACPRGQFVPIDCGSLVGPLMESELFGHVRNAFTGAGEAKRGLLEVASGGTAFFDEIGDLPLELQVKLLRVLQEQEFRPVGGLVRIKVELRIVAATHQNLQAECAAGRFREDLFHRINVIRLTVPPLRERKEDIAMLADRFLEATGRHYVLTPEVVDAMMSYDWPGNIRELKNCVDRMMAMDSGPLLHYEQLPTAILNRPRRMWATQAAVAGNTAAVGATQSPFPFPVGKLNEPHIIPLQELERLAIRHALEYTKGDRTVAAQMLKIGRTTLYRKLKEYEMAEPQAT